VTAFIHGCSQQMQGVLVGAQRVATTDCPVLIVGERGSGRAALAREIHCLSNRSTGPFAEASASTLPVDADLKAAIAALIADADRGTLLLRRIEHLSRQAQRAIVDAHTTHGTLSSGDNRDHGAARLILTSTLEIPRLVGCGASSAYFFEVLSPVVLRAPPLRDRPEDIAQLVAEFLRRESVQIGIPLPALSPGTLAVLSSNRWPGNVAELRDTVVRLLRESPKAVIDGGDLERVLGDDRVGDGLSTLSERNRLYTIEVLERTGGNKSRAAAVLGITRQCLYQRLRAYGLIDDYVRRPRRSDKTV